MDRVGENTHRQGTHLKLAFPTGRSKWDIESLLIILLVYGNRARIF